MAQRAQLERIERLVEANARNLRNMQQTLTAMQVNSVTRAFTTQTIKDYGFGRTFSALNVGFDMSALQVMLSHYDIQGYDYCSNACKYIFITYLLHYPS